MRPSFHDRGHKALDEGVVVLASHPVVAPPYIDRIISPVRIVGAHIQKNGKRHIGVNSSQGGVERKLADRDAHTAGSLVSQAENAFSVAHHDAADLVEPGMGKDLCDPVLVGIA